MGSNLHLLFDQGTQLLGNPVFWVFMVVYWAFSAAVGALEMPDQTSSKFYRWFFKFANRFAANLARAAATAKIPGTDLPVETGPESKEEKKI